MSDFPSYVLRSVADQPRPTCAVVAVGEDGTGTEVAWFFDAMDAADYVAWRTARETEERAKRKELKK